MDNIEMLTKKSVRECNEDELKEFYEEFEDVVDKLKEHFKYGIAKSTRKDIGIPKVEYIFISPLNFRSQLLTSDIENGVDIGIKDDDLTFIQYREKYRTTGGFKEIKNEIELVFIENERGNELIGEILDAETITETEKLLQNLFEKEKERNKHKRKEKTFIKELLTIKSDIQKEKSERLENKIKEAKKIHQISEKERSSNEVFRKSCIELELINSRIPIYPASLKLSFEDTIQMINEIHNITKLDKEFVEIVDSFYEMKVAFGKNLTGIIIYDGYRKGCSLVNIFNVVNDQGICLANGISKEGIEKLLQNQFLEKEKVEDIKE